MIKKILLITAATLISTQALALNRYYAFKLTPAEIEDLIKREGKIILYYRGADPNAGLLYTAAVSNASSCKSGEETKTIKVTAAGGVKVSVKRCVRISVSREPISSPSPQSAPSPAPAPAPTPSPEPEPE